MIMIKGWCKTWTLDWTGLEYGLNCLDSFSYGSKPGYGEAYYAFVRYQQILL